MPVRAKDWDGQVVSVEELARTRGFRELRDRIVERARPRAGDGAVDVGAGTGLLTLALAPATRRVWAIDASPPMVEYLRTKAASAGYANVEPVVASAVSLPLVDGSVTLVVSNYCFHHMRDTEKERALAEAYRVLAPGGRIVIGDMMFRLRVGNPRDRRLIETKIRSLVARGPQGIRRLLKNGARLLAGRWEHPADGEWWRGALERAGFEDVELELLAHEGGVAAARRPLSAAAAGRQRLAAVGG